ncbi:MAG TPA: hypothetical protein VG815_22290 [Chloroflexota bacterium]|jgi:ELWxxDGT repeat protein|nr:hypothetical protein [Chloroflexota bacterium]
MIKRVNMADQGTNIDAITPIGSRVLFTNSSGGECPLLTKKAQICHHSSPVYVSDGTAAGTRLLHTYFDAWYFTPVGTKDIFLTNDPKAGLQLRATDGTAKGTVKLAQMGTFAQNLVVVIYPSGDRAFVFSGQNLWITNGIRSGTRLIRRVASGDGGANVSGAVAGHTFFFTRLSQSHGYQLWRSDGIANGTEVVRDGLGSVKNWPPTVLAPAFGGVLYQTSLGRHGSQLWIAGSSTRRSGRLHNFVSSVNLSGGFATADSRIYFSAPDGASRDALWATDGTKKGTVVVADLNTGHSTQDLIQSVVSIPRPCCHPLVLFEAKDGVHGHGMWRTNGTPASTERVGGHMSFVNPFPLTVGGNRVFFAGYSNKYGNELWTSNGASAPSGTSLARDIFPGPAHRIRTI